MTNVQAALIKMELPDLGEHCSLPNCNQLDFLPFTCANCHQMFCKEHHVTSAHDCKHLNEFFKKPQKIEIEEHYYECVMRNCNDRSPLQLLCSDCNLHYCIAHRHHGCRDNLTKGERKKFQVEQRKKPKEQFKIAKAQVDMQVEMQLRKAEKTQLQPLAQKIRLMKLKSTALGDGKIPTDDRIYFAVHPPRQNSDLKPSSLYTSKQWSVGRTIDLFSKKMKLENKNNEKYGPKLRLFKLSDGELVAKTTCVCLGNLVGFVLMNGDALILDYVSEEELEAEPKLDEQTLEKYRQAVIQ